MSLNFSNKLFSNITKRKILNYFSINKPQNVHKLILRKLHKSSKSQNECKDAVLNSCSSRFPEHMSLSCKVVLVNGGSSGIGLSAASQLLSAGARCVTITGHNCSQGKDAASYLNDSYGMGKAVFVKCNVNSMGQFEDAYKNTLEMYKRIDIVVNAVGICDGEKWEREVVTNIVGTIRGTLLAYRYVGQEGFGKGGCVVNISGASGLEALPSAPTQSASQHAIVGLSRSFGNEIHSKKSGVRVVCLCPGFTKTNFIKNIKDKGMTENLGKQLESTVKRSNVQKADSCGQAVLHLVRHAENGSVWLCEGSRLFLLNIPPKTAYSTLIAQYM